MVRLLVFDFDGVLCDSLQECLFSSFNAYQTSIGRIRAQDLTDIPTSVIEDFSSLRPLVRSGEDYLLLHELIHRGARPSSPHVLDELRTQNKNRLPELKALLAAERARLLKNYRDQWLSLNPLYPSIHEALSKLTPSSFQILSTKPRESILTILDHWGITVPPQCVTHAYADDKIEKLADLIQRENRAPSEVIFVDDQIEYLIEAQRLGVTVYLPTWGYNSEAEHQRAREFQIPLLELDQFKSIL